MTAKTNSLLIALFATCVVPALRADNGCIAATINGAYGFSGSGFEAVHKSARCYGQLCQSSTHSGLRSCHLRWDAFVHRRRHGVRLFHGEWERASGEGGPVHGRLRRQC